MAFVRTVRTTSKTGEAYEYLRIVESYWDKGKRKQRVIANLGNIAVLRKDIKQIVNGLLCRLSTLLTPFPQIKMTPFYLPFLSLSFNL